MNNINERLFVENKNFCIKKYKEDYCLGEFPVVKEVNDGIILPAIGGGVNYKGGVIDKNYNFVSGFIRQNTQENIIWEIKEGYTPNKNDIQYYDSTAIYGGVLILAFGHIISECLSRLWYLIENQNMDFKVVFIKLWDCATPNWFWDLMSLLKLDKSRVVIVERNSVPVQFRRLVVPEQSYITYYGYYSCWNTVTKYMANTAIEMCGEEKLLTLPKKVYYTRKFINSGATRKIINEEYAEQFYLGQGYAIVAPEKLSVIEQVAIAANADAIACNLGTLAHFTLFSKQHIKIDMWKCDNDINNIQLMINKLKEADWCLVDTGIGFLPSTHVYGVNLFGITKYWKEYVKKRFNVDIEIKKYDDEMILYYLKEYCNFFLDYPERFIEAKFGDIDFFDVYSIMCETLLKRKPELCKYNVISKSQLRKQRDDAMNQLAETEKLLSETKTEMQAARETYLKNEEHFKITVEKIKAEMQATRETYSKNEEQFKAALKKSEGEVLEERQSRIKSEREYAKLAAEYNAVRNSLSFKLGRFITFIPRKLHNIFKKREGEKK